MIFAAAAICLAGPGLSDPLAGEPPRLRVTRPAVPAFATSAAGFAPPGWKVERELKGDLNRDGRTDLIVILHGADPRCVMRTEGPSHPTDTNPRVVLVAFGAATGFRLHLANATVIPRLEDPYMDDPLDADALAIRGDVFRLGLSNWRSMGGWSTFSSTLSFRWDGARMRLIGFDRETLRRNTGETETLSVNYLTGRAKVLTGSMQDDVVDSIRWRQLRTRGVFSLETIGDGLAIEPAFAGRR